MSLCHRGGPCWGGEGIHTPGIALFPPLRTTARPSAQDLQLPPWPALGPSGQTGHCLLSAPELRLTGSPAPVWAPLAPLVPRCWPGPVCLPRPLWNPWTWAWPPLPASDPHPQQPSQDKLSFPLTLDRAELRPRSPYPPSYTEPSSFMFHVIPAHWHMCLLVWFNRTLGWPRSRLQTRHVWLPSWNPSEKVTACTGHGFPINRTVISTHVALGNRTI